MTTVKLLLTTLILLTWTICFVTSASDSRPVQPWTLQGCKPQFLEGQVITSSYYSSDKVLTLTLDNGTYPRCHALVFNWTLTSTEGHEQLVASCYGCGTYGNPTLCSVAMSSDEMSVGSDNGYTLSFTKMKKEFWRCDAYGKDGSLIALGTCDIAVQGVSMLDTTPYQFNEQSQNDMRSLVSNTLAQCQTLTPKLGDTLRWTLATNNGHNFTLVICTMKLYSRYSSYSYNNNLFASNGSVSAQLIYKNLDGSWNLNGFGYLQVNVLNVASLSRDAGGDVICTYNTSDGVVSSASRPLQVFYPATVVNCKVKKVPNSQSGNLSCDVSEVYSTNSTSYTFRVQAMFRI